jgi:hypothetical protein
MENFYWTQINNLIKLVRKICKTAKKSRNHLVKRWFWQKDFNKAPILSSRFKINNSRIGSFLEEVQDIQVWWEIIASLLYQEDLAIFREIARLQIPITNVHITYNFIMCIVRRNVNGMSSDIQHLGVSQSQGFLPPHISF